MMTPEERSLLTDLFDRLREAQRTPRDPDAERFIREMVSAQPAAPYYMAQALLVQQQALAAAHERVEELERQLRSVPAPQERGSFLSGMLPWSSSRGLSAPTAGPRPAVSGQWERPAAPGPWGMAPGYAQAPFGGGSYAAAPSQRSGFLGGALQTAAGVAGGILAAEAISSLLSSSPGPFGEALAAQEAAVTAQDAALEAEDAAQRAQESVAHPADSPADTPYAADDFDGGDAYGGDDGGGSDGGGWD